VHVLDTAAAGGARDTPTTLHAWLPAAAPTPYGLLSWGRRGGGRHRRGGCRGPAPPVGAAVEPFTTTNRQPVPHGRAGGLTIALLSAPGERPGAQSKSEGGCLVNPEVWRHYSYTVLLHIECSTRGNFINTDKMRRNQTEACLRYSKKHQGMGRYAGQLHPRSGDGWLRPICSGGSRPARPKQAAGGGLWSARIVLCMSMLSNPVPAGAAGDVPVWGDADGLPATDFSGQPTPPRDEVDSHRQEAGGRESCAATTAATVELGVTRVLSLSYGIMLCGGWVWRCSSVDSSVPLSRLSGLGLCAILLLLYLVRVPPSVPLRPERAANGGAVVCRAVPKTNVCQERFLAESQKTVHV